MKNFQENLFTINFRKSFTKQENKGKENTGEKEVEKKDNFQLILIIM